MQPKVFIKIKKGMIVELFSNIPCKIYIEDKDIFPEENIHNLCDPILTKVKSDFSQFIQDKIQENEKEK